VLVASIALVVRPVTDTDLWLHVATGRWIAEHGEQFPGNIETGLIGESDADQQRFENFANDAPCPALDPESGRCDVYEWRPMTCRVFGPPVRSVAPDGIAGGLGYCDLCFVGATPGEIAACEMKVPHEHEQAIIDGITEKGETIVAFALLPVVSSRNQ